MQIEKAYFYGNGIYEDFVLKEKLNTLNNSVRPDNTGVQRIVNIQTDKQNIKFININWERENIDKLISEFSMIKEKIKLLGSLEKNLIRLNKTFNEEIDADLSKLSLNNSGSFLKMVVNIKHKCNRIYYKKFMADKCIFDVFNQVKYSNKKFQHELMYFEIQNNEVSNFIKLCCKLEFYTIKYEFLNFMLNLSEFFESIHKLKVLKIYTKIVCFLDNFTHKVDINSDKKVINKKEIYHFKGLIPLDKNLCSIIENLLKF